MIGCIIQARMGSTRLPGKILKKVDKDIPSLQYTINQLKFSIDQTTLTALREIFGNNNVWLSI